MTGEAGQAMRNTIVHVAALRISAMARTGDLRGVLEEARKLSEASRPRIEILRVIRADEEVPGCPLKCGLRARVCVARQLAGDLPRRDASKYAGQSQHKRGRDMGEDGGVCFTSQCSTGRVVRQVLGDSVARGIKKGNRSDWAKTKPSKRLAAERIEIQFIES